MNKKMGFEDTIKWYDENAEKYLTKQEKVPCLDLIEKFVGVVGQDALVLDAGCAGGRDSKLLKEKGLNPVGVDLSKSLIEIAKEKNPDIDFVQANFLELPFDDNSFDGVWAHASLLHLETTEEVLQALQEFYRVLKRDGVLHVFVKQQQGEKTAVVSDKLSGHDRFFQFFTKEEIKNLLEKVGFKIEILEDNYRGTAGRSELKWVLSLARK